MVGVLRYNKQCRHKRIQELYDDTGKNKTKSKRIMKHQESTIQINCVKWLRYQYPQLANLFFAIPNGGYRNPVTAKIMKAEGVLAGVADLFLSYPNKTKHGLYIEMKTKAGKQSEYQKQFQSNVEAVGYQYTVCHDLIEFIDTLNKYLKE